MRDPNIKTNHGIIYWRACSFIHGLVFISGGINCKLVLFVMQQHSIVTTIFRHYYPTQSESWSRYTKHSTEVNSYFITIVIHNELCTIRLVIHTAITYKTLLWADRWMTLFTMETPFYWYRDSHDKLKVHTVDVMVSHDITSWFHVGRIQWYSTRRFQVPSLYIACQHADPVSQLSDPYHHSNKRYDNQVRVNSLPLRWIGDIRTCRSIVGDI